MKLHSVIATTGRSLVVETLKSLQACVKPPDYQGVILVENAPERRLEALAGLPNWGFRIDYHHIPESNRGTAYNMLLDLYPGATFYFHDDDIRLSPDALMDMWRVLSTPNGRVFAGGPLEIDLEEKPPAWLTAYQPYSVRGFRLNSDGPVGPGFRLFLGGNWAARVDDMVAAGKWSEKLGPGQKRSGQESDMQGRLRQLGVNPVYAPAALARHYVPRKRCSPRWTLARARRTARGVARTEPPSLRLVPMAARALLLALLLSPIRFISLWRCLKNPLLFRFRHRFVWNAWLFRGLWARAFRGA